MPGGCKRRSKPLPSKPTTGADYGALNAVLRQTLRPDRIIRHWDDINRLAASFQDGLVRPSLVIAKLQALQRHNPLQQAIQELGCLAKTRHILSDIDDSQLRRRAPSTPALQVPP